MFQIKDIRKEYITGDLRQTALDGVTLDLRDNEFVSILGPSGSGKTTLLNVIGGLDRYDSGDLIINGVSTKAYSDRDWDSYRNHTIGFVFQSYHLIPHQSILANVELALTIGGVSRAERKKRAKAVLAEVGLSGQEHKKPNQMSGGQMQRVAIARALVNDPHILLADEPTGALDTETSVQVMELLKKVAEKRLVVMVTHNSELAEAYSTRIVRLRDGRIIGDSDPYTPETETPTPTAPRQKARMSFLTSLALSAQNLRTKKGRTLLTAFAGSIGIIGIALILALSTGVNGYILDIQKDTMSSYPITISAETIDLSGIMQQRQALIGSRIGGGVREETEQTAVWADYSALEGSELLTASVTANDLTAFKRYLDDPDSEIRQYIGEGGVVYTYDVSFQVYTRDEAGNLQSTDVSAQDAGSAVSASGFGGMMRVSRSSMLSGGAAGEAGNFSELMAGSGSGAVSRVVTDSYDLLYGAWPAAYDELILVLAEDDTLPAETLYQLGFLSAEDYKAASDAIQRGEKARETAFSYEDLCSKRFWLVTACDRYADSGDGAFSLLSDSVMDQELLLQNAVELKIVGVVRPRENAANASVATAIGYTLGLTDYVIAHTDESAVVLAQEASPAVNVLTGMRFEAPDDAQKIADVKQYVSALGVSDKASLYTMILYYSASKMDAVSLTGGGAAGFTYGTGGTGAFGGGRSMDEASMAQLLDQWLENAADADILLSLYDEYVAGSSYADNMAAFGKVSYDAPSSISIYTDSFEDKDAVAACIQRYNESADSSARITYTDYVALITSSITSIVDVISYVLIAFVAVSLVVSCIMIGIITHISVLERTREIGILRALGASKRNISQVFNAETVIIGLCAGLLGVGVTVLLTFPINALLRGLTGSAALNVALPVASALILIVLSVVITVIGGLIPARKAAKKDPVVALRTE